MWGRRQETLIASHQHGARLASEKLPEVLVAGVTRHWRNRERLAESAISSEGLQNVIDRSFVETVESCDARS